jgi:hypothetical protein
MMSTSVAPIDIQQINSDLYVGEGYLHTIQEAVSYAVAQGGVWRVLIPAGYQGSDTIAAVTGGNISVRIEDQRDTNPLTYQWTGTIYDGPVILLNGKLGANTTLQLNHNPLDISGTPYPAIPGNGGDGLGYIGIAAADGQPTSGTTGQTGGKGAETLIWSGRGGAAPAGSANGNGGNLFILAGYAGTGAGTPGVNGNVYIQDSNGEEPTALGDTYIGGNTAANATVVKHGGAISVQGFTAQGNIDVTGHKILNVADGVNPTDAVNVSQLAGTVFVYPPAGVPVSTATAWDTSIDPATLALKDADNNFTTTQTVHAAVTSTVGFTPYLTTASNARIGVGQDNESPTLSLFNFSASVDGRYSDIISLVDGLHFRCLSDDLATGSEWLKLTRSGITPLGADFDCGINAPTVIAVGNTPNNPPTVSSVVHSVSNGTPLSQMFVQTDPANERFWDMLPFGGVMHFRALTDDGATQNAWLTVTRTGAVPTNAAFGCNISTTGTITASGGKTFRITHPLDDSKQLVHACIEGPEIAVYYRGEDVTVDGICEITLPNYFEALTMETDRTVQVTALFEVDAEDFGQLAASRVAAGKFRVRSALDSQAFYWEVKAVRRDVAPLEVVTPRKATDDGPTAQRMREATRGFVPAKKKARKR